MVASSPIAPGITVASALGITVVDVAASYATTGGATRPCCRRDACSTEPIAPCAFLCTLPYLAERWRCQDFVRTLNGRRGWYARVVEAGYINVGNRVLALG